jgi:hypothetical protein
MLHFDGEHWLSLAFGFCVVNKSYQICQCSFIYFDEIIEVGLTQKSNNGHNLVHDKEKNQTNRLLPIFACEPNQLYL